jgi:spermidine/putrescine transport system ATP-binding protein
MTSERKGPDLGARAEAAGDTSHDLKLMGVTKCFGSFVAVDNLDLVVPRGSFFGLLGPSGCGKTTTLRMIAGLEQPTSGRIMIGGVDVAGVKPYQRPVNTVFQSYALFPHLSIAENVAFGLRRRGVKRVTKQVADMLALVELESQANKKPAQLSGGQQQRVALARALINKPEVLLLDEPLGALDLRLRRQMQIELKRIQGEVGLTFVHVTHDQEEAMTMADTIAVMNGGVIEQMGTPEDLYENPRTTFVANFLGQSNLIEADVVGRDDDRITVDIAGNRVAVDRSRASSQQGKVWLGVRPEKVSIAASTTVASDRSGDDGDRIRGGVVSDVSFVGVSTQYLVRMPWGQELSVFEQNTGERRIFHAGAAVDLWWKPSRAFLLDHHQDARAGADTLGEQ